MTVTPHPAVSRPLAAALVVAPVLWLAGWTAMRLRTTDGPGALWTTAHSLWIVAFALFAAGCVGLGRLAGGRRASAVTATVVAVASAVATGVQMVIDLVVGLAPDEAAMDARYDSVFAVPGLRVVFYDLAPGVFYAGLLALLILAAVRRAAPAPFVVLAAVGIAAAGVGHGLPGVLRVVEGAGALLILVALAVILRRPARDGLPASA
ncbi:MAG TPA: hypothetical protein VGN37_10495 [Actinocatenispora sp.]